MTAYQIANIFEMSENKNKLFMGLQLSRNNLLILCSCNRLVWLVKKVKPYALSARRMLKRRLLETFVLSSCMFYSNWFRLNGIYVPPTDSSVLFTVRIGYLNQLFQVGSAIIDSLCSTAQWIRLEATLITLLQSCFIFVKLE